MTSPIAGTGSTGQTQATQAPRSTQPGNPLGELGGEAFLKLLVAQLKYQDPTKPTDTTAFMQQTAQLTQVDTMQKMSSQQADMLTAALSTQAAGLVGKNVEYLDNAGARQTGTVTSASFGTNPTVKIGGVDVPLSSVTGQNAG